jgi:CRP-like cAMP-binding protein
VPLTTEPLREEDRLRLSNHPILHDLGEGLRDQVIEKFRVADLATDVHILEEGQANTRLFVVLKGAVSVRLPKDARRVSEVKLATLGAGEVFGEYSLFDARPVSAAVYAAEPTRLAWVEKGELDAFLDAHREVGRRFYEGMIRILVARLRAKNAELDLVTIG